MKITKEWLEDKGACVNGKAWFVKQKETDGLKLVEKLISENIKWAHWLVVRLMAKKDMVRYAVFAAEQVIEIFEKKYPDDKRPREAIDAAKRWIENPTEKNRIAADAAAYSAAYAADAAAYAAAYSAAYAAYSARAADAAAYSAAYSAAYAADAAGNKLKEKIVRYGVYLLKEEREEPNVAIEKCVADALAADRRQAEEERDFWKRLAKEANENSKDTIDGKEWFDDIDAEAARILAERKGQGH